MFINQFIYKCIMAALTLLLMDLPQHHHGNIKWVGVVLI